MQSLNYGLSTAIAKKPIGCFYHTPCRKWQILFIYLLFRNIEALYFQLGFPGPIKV